MGITGKHLVAEGKAVKGDDKRDQDLLAVGAMVTRVAPLRLRVGFRLAFEIGAGHIVEQHLVLDGEQFAAALRQMRFQRGLVGEEMIKPAIEPVFGDLLIAELQQIAQRRAAVPILSDVQFARRLAQPRRHQHGRRLRPGDAFLPDGKQSLAQLLKADPAPQGECKVDIAKSTRAFNGNAFQAYRHRQMIAAIVKKLRAFGSANQTPPQRPPFEPTTFIEFAEMRHRLLNDATTNPHAAHQPPIAVNLPVLANCRVPQIHAPNQI